jgi:hypothetical protein
LTTKPSSFSHVKANLARQGSVQDVTYAMRRGTVIALCLSSERNPPPIIGTKMLVLSRKQGSSIVLDGGITITVVNIRPTRVRLGVVAPKDMKVRRAPAEAPFPPGLIEMPQEAEPESGN